MELTEKLKKLSTENVTGVRTHSVESAEMTIVMDDGTEFEIKISEIWKAEQVPLAVAVVLVAHLWLRYVGIVK